MNAIDAVLLGVILVSVAVGTMRGLVREVFGIVSLAAALVLAYLLGPVLLGVVAGSGAGAVAYLVSCAAVFVVSLVALAIVSRLLTGLLRALHLGGLDRALGGLFGLGRALLVTITVLTILVLTMDSDSPALRESVMLRAHAPGIEWLGTRIPHEGVRREFERRWSALSVRSPLEIAAARPGPAWTHSDRA
jgi:membrane protein required for colicin V production